MSEHRSDEERYSKEAFRRSDDGFSPSSEGGADRPGIFREIKERINEAAETFWPGHDVEGHVVNDFRPIFDFLAKLAIYAMITAFVGGLLLRLIAALG